MKQTQKIATASIVGIVIAILLVFLLNRIPKQSTNQEVPTTIPTPDQTSNLSTEEQITKTQKAISDATLTNLQKALSQKNGWNTGEYKLTLAYLDDTYIAANIEPASGSSIPKGVVFAKTSSSDYEIVFDSTTANPCSVLSSNPSYPAPVTSMMCKTSNQSVSPSSTQGAPTPTDAPNN